MAAKTSVRAPKISPTMRAALDMARAHGGKLVRVAGGFWTYPGCPTKPASAFVAGSLTGCTVPTWYVSVQTVYALVDRELAHTTGFAGGRPPYLVEITIEEPLAPLAQTGA